MFQFSVIQVSANIKVLKLREGSTFHVSEAIASVVIFETNLKMGAHRLADKYFNIKSEKNDSFSRQTYQSDG